MEPFGDELYNDANNVFNKLKNEYIFEIQQSMITHNADDISEQLRGEARKKYLYYLEKLWDLWAKRIEIDALNVLAYPVEKEEVKNENKLEEI
jgi:hypothetical protein